MDLLLATPIWNVRQNLAKSFGSITWITRDIAVTSSLTLEEVMWQMKCRCCHPSPPEPDPWEDPALWGEVPISVPNESSHEGE